MVVVGRRSKPQSAGPSVFARHQPHRSAGATLSLLVAYGDNQRRLDRPLLSVGKHLDLTVKDAARGPLVSGFHVFLNNSGVRLEIMCVWRGVEQEPSA